MEVALLDLSVLDRYFQPQRCAYAIDRSALQLRIDGIRVDREPGIYCCNDSLPNPGPVSTR